MTRRLAGGRRRRGGAAGPSFVPPSASQTPVLKFISLSPPCTARAVSVTRSPGERSVPQPEAVAAPAFRPRTRRASRRGQERGLLANARRGSADGGHGHAEGPAGPAHQHGRQLPRLRPGVRRLHQGEDEGAAARGRAPGPRLPGLPPQGGGASRRPEPAGPARAGGSQERLFRFPRKEHVGRGRGRVRTACRGRGRRASGHRGLTAAQRHLPTLLGHAPGEGPARPGWPSAPGR